MPTFNSLGDLLQALPGAIDRGLRRAAEEIAIDVQIRAQDKLGDYQPGWPQLAEATQQERASLGYSPNDPLFRGGILRSKIEKAVDRHSDGYTAVIGSSAPQARIQELGGVNSGRPWADDIPPRPYLAPAVVEEEDKIQDHVAFFVAEEIGKL